MSWEELSAERLYMPAGMPSTSSLYADYVASPNHAALHEKVDNAWQTLRTRDADAQSRAGGVSSSVRDMTRWPRLQLNNGVLDGKPIVAGESLPETHRPQMISRVPDDPVVDRASFYGLGWGVSLDSAASAFAVPGSIYC
jgi:CubicO group peptidase (beta-lactamase class C family)